MSEEWGPWIEHDGKPRPALKGAWMNVVTENGRDEVGEMQACDVTAPGEYSTWNWDTLPECYLDHRIIRYRLREVAG
ncbi:hypothetical protein [Oceaniglobus trochenteri]|uniref:hypothetical protein n=1 Tax=Oceaniglobus trochenteri TaxID=2763260 RepID=UPI001CFFF1C6|nr:hypothetical protein [Oceaniglobus trochenteri]